MRKGTKTPPEKNGEEQRAPDSGGGNRTSNGPEPSGSAPPSAPDPEVAELPARRTFTAEFKERVLKEADACTEAGGIGALLRRHGLYSSRQPLRCCGPV